MVKPTPPLNRETIPDLLDAHEGWAVVGLPSRRLWVSGHLNRSEMVYEFSAFSQAQIQLDISSGMLLAQATDVQPGLDGDTDALTHVLRHLKRPELAAIASLIDAHRQEYADLIEAEQVIDALGGGR